MSEEHPAFRRLTLTEPLNGWFGDFAVRLVTVGERHAEIEHDDPLPEDACALLRFYWRGHEVEVMATTRPSSAGNRTEVELEPDAFLTSQIQQSATDVGRAFEANLRGDRDANVVGDETVTAASRILSTGFVRWTLTEDGWHSQPASTPDQPDNGFTIAAGQRAGEVAILRRTYEEGDDAARALTRCLAAMSLEPAE